MIWKIRAIEARPVEGNENEYEFTTDSGPFRTPIQILDFTPEMAVLNEVFPPVVVIAYPDRSGETPEGVLTTSKPTRVAR